VRSESRPTDPHNEGAVWLIGRRVCPQAKPTIADCQLYPQIHYFSRGIADFVPKDSLEPFPLTRAWIARMQALPAVKEFETKAGYNA